MTYRQLNTHPDYRVVWNHSSANEFGRLAQGIGGRIQGTDTIRFVRKIDIPPERLKDATYGKFVCEEKPNKAEVQQTRLTVGGDRINYPDKVGTPIADLLLATRQDTFEQCSLHAQCTVHDNRYQQLLLKYTNEATRVRISPRKLLLSTICKNLQHPMDTFT